MRTRARGVCAAVAFGLLWLGAFAPAAAPAFEPVVVGVNLLVLDDGVTELTRGARYAGPEAPVGALAPGLDTLFEWSALALVNGIFKPCGLRFELRAARALRPELLASPLDGSPMAGVFSEQDGRRVLDLGSRPSTLDVLSLFTVERLGANDPLGLFRQGPYLNLFVVGAPLTRGGERGALATGQINGRHAMVSLATLAAFNGFLGMETIAHEWGHNLGLMHTETDGDAANLMSPNVNPSGKGNRGLTASQCAVARTSPLLYPHGSVRPGTLRVPGDYPTIQAAVGAAAAGATVEVAGGDYDESVFLDKPLTLQAAPGASVRLQRALHDNLPTLMISNGADVTVQGLTIAGQGIFVLNSVDVTLRDNVVAESLSHGLYARNVRLHAEGNAIRDNALKGVLIFYALDSTLRANTITGNLGQFGAGVVLSDTARVSLEANTITHNLEGVVLLTGNRDVRLIDNVIRFNEDFGLFLYPLSAVGECRGNAVSDNRVDTSENFPAGCFTIPEER